MKSWFNFGASSTTPRPAGTPAPTFFEQLQEVLPDWLWQTLFWGYEYRAQLFACFLVLLWIKIVLNYQNQYRRQIIKLWKFVLFFLAKRQMMVPLVMSLAKTENVIAEEQIQKLLLARKECQNHPLKADPVARMKAETEVSEVLYQIFQQLESRGVFQTNKRLQKLVEDFEFIDEKLVELQALYNREARQWNKNVRRYQVVLGKFRPFQTLPLFE